MGSTGEVGDKEGETNRGVILENMSQQPGERRPADWALSGLGLEAYMHEGGDDETGSPEPSTTKPPRGHCSITTGQPPEQAFPGRGRRRRGREIRPRCEDILGGEGEGGDTCGGEREQRVEAKAEWQHLLPDRARTHKREWLHPPDCTTNAAMQRHRTTHTYLQRLGSSKS